MKIVGERPPLLPEGVRELWFDDWSTSKMFGRPKVTLWFQVPGERQEAWIRLPRHYNASGLDGTPGPQGLFTMGWKSDYLREYANYFDLRADGDLSPERFTEVRAWGEIKTVTADSKRADLPRALQYSVIARLLPPQET